MIRSPPPTTTTTTAGHQGPWSIKFRIVNVGGTPSLCTAQTLSGVVIVVLCTAHSTAQLNEIKMWYFHFRVAVRRWRTVSAMAICMPQQIKSYCDAIARLCFPSLFLSFFLLYQVPGAALSTTRFNSIALWYRSAAATWLWMMMISILVVVVAAALWWWWIS